MKNATKKPRSKQSLESQIAALQNAYQRLVSINAGTNKLFAVNGKIKKLQKELDDKKFDEFLAK